MLTCIVRPVINKKFNNFDVTEFTKLSQKTSKCGCGIGIRCKLKN